MLLRSWAIQKRMIIALMLRDVTIRYGRRNLGFAWLFFEPLVFAFPVIWMWSYIRHPFENGLPMIALVWSGYLPILLFRHVVATGLRLFSTNASIFYHRLVTPFDLFAARCGLEAFGNVASALFSFLVLYQLGVIEWPHNILLMFIGFAYMTWWSLAMGLILAGLSERSELVIHFWMPISYIYLPVSGFMYINAWLPSSVRWLALTLMPSTHAYDMIRAGLFGNVMPWFYDLTYVTYVLTGLTILGLWLLRDVRQYMELEG